MPLPDYANFQWPSYGNNLGFPFNDLPAQLRAAMNLFGTGQSGQGRYERFAPPGTSGTSYPPLFGGAGGGYGRPTTTTPLSPITPGRAPVLPGGGGGLGSSTTKAAPVPSVAPDTAPSMYQEGGMWGGNGPIQASALTADDRLAALKMMNFLPGIAPMLGGLLGGSAGDVTRALTTLPGQGDPYDVAARQNAFDLGSYSGQLAPYFQAWGRANPAMQGVASQYGLGGLFGAK